MTNPSSRWIGSAAACVTCAALGLVLTGCGGGEEPTAIAPTPAPVNTTPPPPPRPAVTPIADLMVQYGIDERIVLPENKAPNNDADRIAVLSFFDAFARGDDMALRTMLPALDQLELDVLVQSGVWSETVPKIEQIDVETGLNRYNVDCALALFTVEGDFQPQLWYYTAEGEEYTFDAAPTPPGILDKLYGDNWITAWHDVLEEELALADKPDEKLTIEQVDIAEENSGGGGGQSPNLAPNRPGSFPGPGRRTPTRPPRRPPGPG